jgi:TolB protein
VEPLASEEIKPPPGTGTIVFPAWSPDGRMIAFRAMGSSGNGGIYVLSAGGGDPQRAISEPVTTDPLSWAPDSRRIAFANASKGNMDIYQFDVFSGGLEPLTSHDGSDTSPSWSRSGDEIVFCSDRSGASNIWAKNLTTGALNQLSSDGGNSYPAVSPDGRSVAWVSEGEGVVVLDRRTGGRTVLESPKEVSFAPAWSPDGRVIAVTATDWGGADVYLSAADGSGALLLTKSVAGDGMPSWAPDGRRMVIASNQDGVYSLRILNGVEVFAGRVLNPVAIRTFPRPVD